jgi:iron complex outermembrane receptor protein
MRTRAISAGAAIAGLWAVWAGAAWADEPQFETADLNALSIEQLGDVPVTSVSGTAQPLGEAPAAIYVITSDDLNRAGVRTISGALRLAPNLHVGRINASTFGISARGFNHNTGTANKLLVLVDGRIVYTPLFSGVFWDEQNAIIEDIDRIEVISGPGGTLWGSNAVNGVVNIVSRDSHETTGFLATGSASEASQALGLRYGARFGATGAFRVYALGLRRAVDEPDEWRNAQGGFRSDWVSARDTLTLQGDVYSGGQDALSPASFDTNISGGNLLGRWTRRFDGEAELQVQAYIDRTQRRIASGIQADVDAAAVDALYSFSLAPRHSFVLGGGARVTQDSFTPGPGTVLLDPDERTLQTYNVFVQDTIELGADLDLIVGVKLEDNSYTGLETMPSARLAWRPSDDALLWLAVSRAVRTPARFDRDLSNPGVFAGGPNFVSEQLVAYELGYRAQVTSRLWLSLSSFYNVYDDLRTVEATGPLVFPLEVRNGMRGETYGLEAWGSYAVTEWWRLNGGVTLLQKDLELRPGSADVFGVNFAGNDPEAQASVRSLMDIGERTQLDLTLRYVDDLPSPSIPSYVTADARIGYRVNDHLELSITGYNLLDDHVEFINPALPPQEVSSSVFISARWRS